MGTIVPCCSSAVHHAWRLHSRLHLGRKCRLEKVALVVRRSEAAGWRWSSSTLNECKPRFLGVAVMHWARTMATELRDSRSGRRQGSSSDWRVPYGALHTLRRSNYENPSLLIIPPDGRARYAATYLLVISLTWHTTIASTIGPVGQLRSRVVGPEHVGHM